jgi:hypothetical protein
MPPIEAPTLIDVLNLNVSDDFRAGYEAGQSSCPAPRPAICHVPAGKLTMICLPGGQVHTIEIRQMEHLVDERIEACVRATVSVEGLVGEFELQSGDCVPVPEPPPSAMLAIGLVAIVALSRWRSSRRSPGRAG